LPPGRGGREEGSDEAEEEEEEEEGEGEGIPLVEYHHAHQANSSPNLRVPPPEIWHPNGGARPKQRYEVGTIQERSSF
jgi:hypothetical protein